MIIEQPMPKYIAPEKTGDVLDDQIAEVAAHRAWILKCAEVQAGNEKRLANVRSQFAGLDYESFSETISKVLPPISVDTL